jgi:serine protease AprX
MRVEREWLEHLIFGLPASRRFTQDSPVLPDVWIECGMTYHSGPDPLDLLLTPHRDKSAAELSRELRRRLQREQTTEQWQGLHLGTEPSPEIAYHQASVVAKLYLDELVRVVLPLSSWWHDDISAGGNLSGWLQERREALIQAMQRVASDPEQVPQPLQRRQRSAGRRATERDEFSPNLLWLIRVVGTILLAAAAEDSSTSPSSARQSFVALSESYAELVAAFAQLVAGMTMESSQDGPFLYTVTRNRPVSPTVWRSTLAVKADAARRLFNISCRNLAWAVLDSGIDATHPAFRKRTAGDQPATQCFPVMKGKRSNNTRIVATFQFTKSHIRRLLSVAVPAETKSRMAPQAAGRPAGKSGEPGPAGAPDAEALEERAKTLAQRLDRGWGIDWDELRPFLEVPHDDGYQPPRYDHGTHVAGILAGDWRQGEWDIYPRVDGDLTGICPDLELYDFRVLDENGVGDEFSVMAALQFLRYLNSQRERPIIHGANLSLAMKHDVANYACGRTPVCEECERVVNSGVVVVAAAGNDGYLRMTTPSGDSEGYRSISISDPGNADAVITVGATHRYQPHTYGVSYFSSRGPTGDGRQKPDLVAPGEKITAPVPGGRVRTKDGTSMAAPHVSGAAALLMARHRELMGMPQRVKQVLCTTATDLARERYFQGTGMLDILRALQSV